MPHSSAHAPCRRLLVATNNPGKLAEIRSLLAGMPFAVQSMGELNLASPQETGDSYRANALLKARNAAATASIGANGSPVAALAEDSGLEVDALGGAPGIWSARYAGLNANAGDNNAKLIAALAGVAMEQRRARYRCALVWVDSAEDDRPLMVEGSWEGYILESPRGTGGFGYDPYFWLPELGMTVAQLDPEHKNRLSHRGAAMRALLQGLNGRQRAPVHDN
jgi:XTP/dITP diphosphohydrolase